jgi:hypothetical protein
MKMRRFILVSALTAGAAIGVHESAGAAPDRERSVPRHACSHSDWMTSAGGLGSGAAFRVSMKPTARARAFGGGKNPLNGHYYVEYIWRDLNRCVRFPPLTTAQTQSLFKQLECHALYAKIPQLGGPTWDFEAWRENISQRDAVHGKGQCNWPPAHPPAAPGETGSLVPEGGGTTVQSPGRKTYTYETWKAAPGFRSPSCSYDDPKCTVGELHAGSNFFYCQTKSSRGETDHGYHNHWWLYTELDSPRGAHGWVSAIYVKVGGQEQPIPGLPLC